MAAELFVGCFEEGEEQQTCFIPCTTIRNLSLISTYQLLLLCNNTEAKIKMPMWKSRCCLDRVIWCSLTKEECLINLMERSSRFLFQVVIIYLLFLGQNL